ncbi:MAG: hypothetical protein ACE15B_22370 [Bryobacteraceae bacterium]
MESALRGLIAICRQVQAAMEALEPGLEPDSAFILADFVAAAANVERWCAPDALIDLDRITSAMYRFQRTYNTLLDHYRDTLTTPARLEEAESRWMLGRCAQPLHAVGAQVGRCRQELAILSLVRAGRLPGPRPENVG